ncbi:MAG TPA: serine hydrolase domain-containing protein [Polyangiaceae bacterium]|nr:serine hydrolase domain-containing protein [Polyangiaceae bacterium]
MADQLEKQLGTPRAGGAAVCIYHHGECVVDAWGGARNQGGEPWQSDTLAMSYSTTKGVVATLVLALVDQGLIDYDDPVAKYWPEFAQEGKERVMIRHLLSHQAGLHGTRDLVDHADRMLDWDFMTRRLAAARPAFPPGTRPGYHGLTFGWLVGELVRRVTAGTVNDAVRKLLVGPLALDGAFIGAPVAVRPRLAELLRAETKPVSGARSLSSTLGRAAWSVFGMDRSHLKDALLPHGSADLYASTKLLDAEVPALNGFFTARSLARMYATLAEGGQLEGTRVFSESTIRRATEIQSRKLDAVVGFPMRWRLGYHTVGTNRGILPNAFGHFGYGGSGAWADPDRRLAVAMTLNRVAGTPFGDMRMARIGGVAARCAERRRST